MKPIFLKMSENFLSFQTTPKAQLGQTDFFPTLTYKTTTLSAFSTVFWLFRIELWLWNFLGWLTKQKPSVCSKKIFWNVYPISSMIFSIWKHSGAVRIVFPAVEINIINQFHFSCPSPILFCSLKNDLSEVVIF